ncbi:glycosyltransferase family 4 protein [Solicola sp. PLA-1-18]|uniref:glycosyltransferase family 4 protein n=1 Tax=Solicola sp. PLA-1-18 TaxID=3380532 RepID=UPI003B7A7CD8
MRIGLVCPYALHVPGGVQNHVVELARSLRASGHHVSVLAPTDGEPPTDPPVVSAGRAVPVPYNGSVARVAFGPLALARTRRWVRGGGFDLLHVHEPATPSVSLMALGLWDGPAVATFHSQIGRSRAMTVSEPVLRPALARLDAAVAVSDHALAVVERWGLGTDVQVIPNGLDVAAFDVAAADRERRPGPGPRLVYLGRFDEPRKGLAVALAAMPHVVEAHPDAHLVVAGAGHVAAARRLVPDALRDHVEVVGRVDDRRRARLLAGADVYLAPQTGGESFGVVLLEAMAAGAPVVASDLPAFHDVLAGGRWGRTFAAGSARALAGAVADVLADPGTPARARGARRAVRAYDWSEVTRRVLDVYAGVTDLPSTGRRTS